MAKEQVPSETLKPKKKHTELFRTIKYFIIAASAGLVQVISTWIFNNTILIGDEKYHTCYLLGLILSVIWNFTFNRRYTFKSANNVPVAMFKVFLYYLVFTPLSDWWVDALVMADFWPTILRDTTLGETTMVAVIVQVGTVLFNGITEFLYQRFFVFGKTIDTNDVAKKNQEKEAAKKAAEEQ